MISTKQSFFDETSFFIHNHKLICGLTFGLAIVVYAIGNLMGRTVSWIKECCGTARKTDGIAKEILEKEVTTDLVSPQKNDSSVNQDEMPPCIPTNVDSLKPIFEELIQKAKRCVSFHEPKVEGNPAFNNFTRFVQVGIDGNSKALIFIKIPWGRYSAIQKNALKREQLSFQISHALGLDVVPTTKVIPIEHIGKNPFSLLSSNSNCIVQNAVSTSQTQFHLKSDINSQELNNLNLFHIHKAIIFNMLLGRHDGRAVNSVIDSQMRVMEIDNEFVGLRTTDSWLLETFKETALSTDFVKSFIKFEKKIIFSVLENMTSQGLAIDNDTKSNIIYNFDKIQSFFIENQNKKIRVSDLIAINK